jgi:glycosyltransferase involved in cell wall biosynthesis
MLMRPAKILAVHNRYQQRGGEDEAFEQEVRLLRRNGHTVIEYVETNDDLDPTHPLRDAVEAIWSRKTLTRLGELTAQERPDLAHFHNTFARISPAAYYGCRRAGIPVVQTLHNFRIGCLNAACMINNSACQRCVPRLVPLAGILNGCYRGSRTASAAVAAITSTHKMVGTYRDQVDAYIALGEFARRIHARSGIPEHKLYVKPNFAEPQPPSSRSRNGFALFVGRLCPEKGITTLISAWERANLAVPLRIAGDGPEAAAVAAAAARVAGIEWLGVQPHAEVLNLMHSAQFLVVPSIAYENCGLCIVEAFSAGLPCVVSDLGSMKEIVSHGETGLHFQTGNAGDLAAQVHWVAAHPEEREQMGQAARRCFMDRFSPDNNYRILLKIYDAARRNFRAQYHREAARNPSYEFLEKGNNSTAIFED